MNINNHRLRVLLHLYREVLDEIEDYSDESWCDLSDEIDKCLRGDTSSIDTLYVEEILYWGTPVMPWPLIEIFVGGKNEH